MNAEEHESEVEKALTEMAGLQARLQVATAQLRSTLERMEKLLAEPPPKFTPSVAFVGR